MMAKCNQPRQTHLTLAGLWSALLFVLMVDLASWPAHSAIVLSPRQSSSSSSSAAAAAAAVEAAAAEEGVGPAADDLRGRQQRAQVAGPNIPAAYPGFEAAFQGECGRPPGGSGGGGGGQPTVQGLGRAHRTWNGSSAGQGNPCEHICLDLHDGTYECSCFYGFTLAVDGYSCSAAQRQEVVALTSAPETPSRTSATPSESAIADSISGTWAGRNEHPTRSQSEPSRPEVAAQAGRLQYQLSVEEEAAASNEERDNVDDDTQQLSAIGTDMLDLDTDSDIKSVMDQNDGLVHELIQSVAHHHWSPTSSSGRRSRFPKSASDLARKTNSSSPDYELLASLIQKTIQSSLVFLHEPLERRLDHLEADSRRRSAASGGEDNNSHFRSTKAAQHKLSEPTPYELAPSWPDNPLGCGIIDGKLVGIGPHFEDCAQMPECESGGQCVVEILAEQPDKPEGRVMIDERRRSQQATQTAYWPADSSSGSDGPSARRRVARCRCPVGRAGYLCQKPLQRSVPQFMGHSYLALPATSDRELDDLRLVFKPRAPLSSGSATTSQQAALLLLQGHKFLLLLDNMNRIELRYFSKETPRQVIRVIGSRDAELDRWNELRVTDASRDNNGLADKWTSGANRILLVTPDKVQLYNDSSTSSADVAYNTIPDSSQDYNGVADDKILASSKQNHAELFVGGRPESLAQDNQSRSPSSGAIKKQRDRVHASALGETTTVGFTGCIKELSINQQSYNFRSDLTGDTLDGLDIGECCD